MNQLTESHIIELEEQLRQAMLTSNVAVLDTLIAPELLFTSHLGQLLSKEADLEMHRSGILKLKELVPSDRHIQCHEGFAVVSAQMHLLGTYDGMPLDANIRYTRVWATSSADALQIIAGQASLVTQ
jgi:hypothetical protein